MGAKFYKWLGLGGNVPLATRQLHTGYIKYMQYVYRKNLRYKVW